MSLEDLKEIYKGYGLIINPLISGETGKTLYEAEITFEGDIIHTEYYDYYPVSQNEQPMSGYQYIESILQKMKKRQRDEKLKRLGL